MGQEREMSNYEKYVLAKEQAATPDTIVKYDTVLVGDVKQEWDDLYYIPSKDDLRRKRADIRLTQKKIRIEQNALYYDAQQEVYEDLWFDSMYRHSFYFGFRPSYYYYGYGYNSFYYNPWMMDSWYWNYPYYSYYPYYNNWYGGNYWGYNYNHNNYYSYSNYNQGNRYGSAGILGSNRNYYNPSYKTYKSGYTVAPVKSKSPVVINRTVSVDRRSGNVISSQNSRTITPQSRTITPQNKSTYSSTDRTYTPSYSTPRMPAKPQFNNSKATTPSRSVGTRITAPIQNRTQTRTITPSRSSTYTAPSRSATPARSFSTPTQSRSSSSNFNSGSSGMSRSSGSSSSGSSTSGSSSRSSGGSTSSGRR